ncbi:Uncharacterised protein [Legionella lansingensis]|uniref:Uncharacterized protein n=1 Tax=Legionella lansingensis TaxID=45067 RepID=A0A0W0VQF9_9GAMM|nr:hypothetical protein [Legionella lansingensis]KTD22296.1 hypothetical protein Llan_1237 [Legionella lansingensis]SNV50679.1 Uncharacterised protein [Legionella lansingensis]
MFALLRTPIVNEFVGLPIYWPSKLHLSEHTSCLVAWSEFGKGPRPGERAPDVYNATSSKKNEMHWLLKIDSQENMVYSFLRAAMNFKMK